MVETQFLLHLLVRLFTVHLALIAAASIMIVASAGRFVT